MGTPAHTHCLENLLNRCIISEGATPHSAVAQLPLRSTSASSETGERNTELSPSPETLCEPVPARSAPPASSGAAGERCPGRPSPPCPPESGRDSVGRFARAERIGAGRAGRRLRFQKPSSRRCPGRGPGGTRPAQPPAGSTTRRLFPSIPAGLLCLPGAVARPVLSQGSQRRERSPAVASSGGGREDRSADEPRDCDGQSKKAGGDPLHSPPFPSPRLRRRRCPRRRRQPRIPRRRQGPALLRPLPRGSPTCSEESIHLGVGDSAFLRRPFGGIHGWGRGGGEPGGW